MNNHYKTISEPIRSECSSYGPMNKANDNQVLPSLDSTNYMSVKTSRSLFDGTTNQGLK